jgi:D-alanyl-D-alanine endopeptidase (penicillin-binding protein 7)
MKSTNNGYLHRRLLTLALLPTLLLALSANAKVGPELKSRSVVVVDESDASVLYAKKANAAVPIASITKLMTALVVLESGEPLDEAIKIAADDRDLKYGSGSRLTVGSELTREDLLHLSLMSSENRAAHALGRVHPGGMAKFVRAMNVKAKALGMTTARFADPTGLSNKNVSSASDLVKLVMAASEHPLIRRYSTSQSHVVQIGKQMLEFRNTNTLVNKEDWDIALQKTGYTSEAGQCLVMKTTIQERPVVMVFLNSFGKLTRVAEARRIRKWMERSAPSSQLASSTAQAAAGS